MRANLLHIYMNTYKSHYFLDQSYYFLDKKLEHIDYALSSYLLEVRWCVLPRHQHVFIKHCKYKYYPYIYRAYGIHI